MIFDDTNLQGGDKVMVVGITDPLYPRVGIVMIVRDYPDVDGLEIYVEFQYSSGPGCYWFGIERVRLISRKEKKRT